MSQDASRELTQIAVGEFIEILNPLKKFFSDPEAREAVLGALGVPPLQAGEQPEQTPNLDLSGLDGYVGNPDPGLQEFQHALEEVLNILQTGRAWAQSVAQRDGAPDADKLFSLVLTLVTTSHFRNCYPVTWSILRLLGFVEDKIFGHAFPTWELNRIGEFWSEAGSYFAQRYNHDENERAVQALSDGLFVASTLTLIFGLQKRLARIGVDLGVLYGWELQADKLDEITDEQRLLNRSFTVRATVKQAGQGQPAAQQSVDLFLNLMVIPKSQGGGIFVTVAADNFKVITKKENGDEGWTYAVEAPVAPVSFWMASPGLEVVSAGGEGFKFKATPPPNVHPWKLLKKGARLEMSPDGFELGMGTGKAAGRVALKTSIIISTDGADSFIAKVIGAGEFKVDLDLALILGQKGVSFEGGAGLEIVVPVMKAISIGAGSVTLQQMMIGVSAGTVGNFQLDAGAAISFKLGPFTAVVEQLGVRVAVKGFESKDDVSIGFKPPKGVGISVGRAGLGGGGYLFFDYEQEQYAGALVLAFEGLATFKVIGLLTTKLPDDPDGFSLLLIIMAEGFAPQQLGFGFMLTGVGGLLGVHRASDPEVLRAGIKNRTVDAIMFPKDPVGNAPALVAQLGKIFPAAADHYTIGLMAQIMWGHLMRMNLGLLVEVSWPGGASLDNLGSITFNRIIILGKIAVFAPAEQAPLVEFNLDVIGVLDFSARNISIDATLYDSRVLLYTITGDMALRANWGDKPDFAVSVGGFHPKFPPLENFPKLERAAITLAAGNNPRIRTETYYALTSNSFQMGARAELYAAAGGFSVQGYIGWDLLIYFDPFSFRADFAAGLALKSNDVTLMSIRIEGAIGGFSPLWVSGSGSISILFFSIWFNFKYTLVEGGPPASALPVDVLGMLLGELADGRNWTAQLPPQFAPLFSVRKSFGADEIVVHPLAQLAVRQTVVPLGLEIEKFGQSEPAGDRHFQITSVKIGNADVETAPVTGNFAPGQFFDLTDAERLTRPSFEKMQAGVRVGSPKIKRGPAVERELTYETKVVQPETEMLIVVAIPYEISQHQFEVFALSGAVAKGGAMKSGRSKYAGPKIGVTYTETAYAVASKGDLKQAAAQPAIRSYSMAKQEWKSQQAAAPDAQFQIVNIEETISL